MFIGETFGFVHIEAASQGLPVIAFDMMANRESIALTSSGQILLVPYEKHQVIRNLANAIIMGYQMYKDHITGIPHIEACQVAKDMYTYWNHQQHSLALIDMIKECLLLKYH